MIDGLFLFFFQKCQDILILLMSKIIFDQNI